jgi:hypothetical protein
MPQWRLDESSDGGLRLTEAPPTRGFGEENFTWADLLYFRLAEVRLYMLYFPSRFGLPVDAACMDLLHRFGENTPISTSVNFWDPHDEHFTEALGLFRLSAPPALVLAIGLQTTRDRLIDDSALYCITFTDKEVLGDPERLAEAVNLAHEVLTKGKPNEIAALIRSRNRQGLVTALGAAADRFVKLQPKLGLPGGFSIAVGGS